MPSRPRRIAAAVLSVLVVAAILPGAALGSETPRMSHPWISQAADPAALREALAGNPHKIPVEFEDRLRYALPDGTLRVMVALTARDAEIESFVQRNTTAAQWYGGAPRFLGRVSPEQLASLVNADFVSFVAPDYILTDFMASSTVDVHARSLTGDGTGVWSYDPATNSLKSDIPSLSVDQATGKGVTVAVTDSGIDRTHRDFGGWSCAAGPYQPCESRIVRAVTIEHMIDAGLEPGDSMPTTEFASGHGTHVAGTIAGNAYYGRGRPVTAANKTSYGADGYNFGIAPQANLISTKNGDVIWAGLSTMGLQWQLDNAAEYDIKVSSNSWGCLTGCSFNANSVEAGLFRDMYEAGIVVVFAAGNGGGTQNGNAFSGFAQSPYVLGVANYDDSNYRLASSSSRGSDNTLPDPATWTPQSEPASGERRPDVGAPGTNIWSARALTGGAAAGAPRVNSSDVVGGGANGFLEYTPMSGTSMATPHVAGAAALMFSACPSATPLDVMRAVMIGAHPSEVLKTTGPATAEPFEVGHGSLEVRSSLDWLRNQPICGGTGGGTDPDPTPTDTPTTDPTPTTSPPPPAGERGTYPVTPNDKYFGPGRNFGPTDAIRFDTQWGPQKIQAPQAWQEIQSTGYGVDVAVLDSGVDLGHPDLDCPGKLNVVANSDTVAKDSSPQDENGHGTHVAGIIGACTNNETGIAGVAPDVRIMPVRVLNAAGNGTVDQIVSGIRRATAAGAEVINMSLSQREISSLDLLDNADFDAAIQEAAAAGVVIVAAAGNDGFTVCNYPALAEEVICVGATDTRDNKSWYSNFADKMRGGPAVVAPGGLGFIDCGLDSEEILSLWDRAVEASNDCDRRPGYAVANGTSMAAPHVAGVAALVYDRLGGQRSPENAEQVIDAIVSGVKDLGPPGYDPVYGYGRVDALAAVRAVDAVVVEDPEPAVSTVEFTQSSASSSQYSDDASIEARLTAEGEPISDADLVFELTGATGTRTWTAVTNQDGVATTRETFRDEPGAYQLTVRYAGVEDAYLPSADTASFAVEKDDSKTALVVTGGARDRGLQATVTDVDSSQGLASVPVEFFVDGRSLGTATTGGSGVAAMSLPAKYRSGPHKYEAVFGGNGHYLGSRDARQT